MDKKYTKKELEEAIKHWSNELERIEEKEELEDIKFRTAKESELLSEHDPDDPDYGQYYDDNGPSEDEMDDAQEEVESWINDNIEAICKNVEIEVPADLAEIDDWPNEDEWRAQAYFDSLKEFGKEWLDAMNVDIDLACDKVLYDFRKILKKPSTRRFEECDGGGMAAGGDAGGSSAGAAAAGGDFTTATSTEDVLGKFDPSKGVLGVKDYHIPAKVKVPFTRLAGNGGGSVRKKDKNGKPKSYYPEKGMKVVDYTKESIDESYDWMIEEAASLKKGKTVEVKNDILHCKTKEKADLEKVSPMKKTNEKPSNATSEKIKKIKSLKLSKAELKDLEKCGSIATMQFDEDADNLCLGDILNVGNVHCKVASKRWLKDVNEHPFKDLLTAKDLEACKSAKKIALVVLSKMQ